MIRYLTVFVLSLAVVSTAGAQNDRIRTSSGTEAGKISAVSPVQIEFAKGSIKKEIPVSEIESVQFGAEPSELTQARVNARNGGYQKAMQKLAAINLRDVKEDLIRQEIQFYKAFCTAQLAILGEADVSTAGRELTKFVNDNPNSFHRLQVTEVLGDLLAASGRYDKAAGMYRQLAKAPWPSYKVRAGVLIGKSLQAQEKHAEALTQFQEALALADDIQGDDTVGSQRLAAELGKAISLAATGKVDEGVKLVQSVLKGADPSDQQLQATAYNALGSCYRQAGKTKDALFAFLHVDLLFPTVPEAHAEALHHLAPLWEEIGKAGRAKEARQTLNERYASSKWAKQ